MDPSEGRRARGSAAFAIAVLACATFGESSAVADAAPDKITCAHAYERAQRLREGHMLRGAREQLLVCVRPECPTLLHQDCTLWLGEVDAATPSVVVTAHTADGRAQTNVRVTVDGTTLADRITTAPIALDPGAHTLIFEMDGAPRVSEHVTLREGEREHRIDVTFTPPPPPPSEPRAPSPPPVEEPRARPPPTLAYAVGAVGIVITAVGTIFQVIGMNKRSSLYDCEPRCATSDVGDARRDLWVGNVALGAGILTIASAAILYFVRPEETTAHGSLGAR